MKKEIHLHPDFKYLKADIAHLISEKEGDIIYGGRNQVKIVEVNNEKFVVKHFKKITFANKIIYRFFRKSKAHRSYDNALKLKDLGIPTPEPVAYVAIYGSLTLKRSIFISRYVDYEKTDPSATTPISEDLVEGYANFIHFLHQKGVFHQDLNLGNMLFKKINGVYQFCLIDNNRMRFHAPTVPSITKNLNRVYMPFKFYSLFTYTYALLAEINPYLFMQKLLKYRKKKILKNRIKYSFKHALGLI